MKRFANQLSAWALLPFFMLVVACSHNNDGNPSPRGNDRANEEYQRLMNARINSKGVSFDISEITLTNDILSIRVKGGCSGDDYKIVWDGIAMMAYPQTINLVVANESSNDSCSGKGDYALKVDLKKLLGDSYNPNDFVVQVSNGSKVEDKIVDEDGGRISFLFHSTEER